MRNPQGGTVAGMERLSDLTEKMAALTALRGVTMAAICKGLGGSSSAEAVHTARQLLGSHSPHIAVVEKATTAAMLSSDAGLDMLRVLSSPWADLVRRQTVVGSMGGSIRRVTRATPITIVDTGMAADFVTEFEPIPVVRPTLTDYSLMPGKVAVITPYSAELVRASADRAAVLIERDQSRAVAIAEDRALLDSLAAVSGGRPASILTGLSPVGAGASPSVIEEDVIALMAAVRGGDFVAPFFVTSPAGARFLLTARDSNGQRLYPNVTARGGDIYGIPLIVSAGAPDILALIDADALLVVDEDLVVDTATQAAFQFETEPTAGAANVVSLYQTNSFAVRTERYIGWRLAWSDGAAFIELPA